ncbi:MAG: glcE [Nocardioides sp.]|jgi:glycolate oxidase FAD binding subunit|nr:glcE [Nocardioides sp.]
MATSIRPETLEGTAREAIASACASVSDPGEADRVDGLAPGVVARPADTDQVAELLRAAAAHDLTVVPRGRGTKLSWGLPPTGADVLLDVSGLDQVLDHAAGDLIAVTQAGARLADLQEVVARGGQCLALDETVPGSSVGGTLATNTSGPRRVATGTARDLLIGVTVVRADGVVAKAGGRVVKNVAGYDLGKLVIGSLGTLGVITEAVFRLHPVPEARRWVSVPVADPAAAQVAVQSVLHSQAVPGAIEVEWGPSGGRVHVLLEGRPDGVAGRTESVCSLLGDSSAETEEVPAYPWDVTAAGDDRSTALKLTFALSGLAKVLEVVHVTGVRLRGSAGAGVAYAAVAPGTPPDEVRSVVDALREACAGVGGTLVVVDAPAAVKAAVDVWGPVPALDLMRRVKDQFDPDHRLAPGRFVGGI